LEGGAEKPHPTDFDYLMTSKDDRTPSHDDGERIDHLAEWLEVTLGPRLTAYAVGVTTGEIARYAHGDDAPGRETEQRIRNLYRATWFVASNDGPGSAHDWLCEPNPKLDDRAPAELLRDGEVPVPLWFSASTVY
jgi:uncharacterized protein (DUF2384 family)